MGRHILEEGKKMIAGIVSLGESLGYVVKEEFPLEKKPGNAPAVDVAWLSDEGHDFPLMIFEIESKVSSSVMNNPGKVFGHPNEHLEKPLFFFHIFLEGTKNSSKLDILHGLFGAFNYRTYELSKEDEITRLVIDVMSQHRRLYRKVNLENVIKTLDSEVWMPADIEKVLISLEERRFTANYLKTYASFSFHNPAFIRHYLRFLELQVNSHPKKSIPQEYGTYWGDMWSWPIHYGILVSAFPDKSSYYLEQLQNWQEKGSYISMIGPHFGLSRDYDEFILGLCPPFFAFLAALMNKCPDGVRYIADQCQLILSKLNKLPPKISFFTAVWLLHIASSVSSIDHFEAARSEIEGKGGISEVFLYNPPDSIPLQEIDTESDKRWVEKLQENPVHVPAMDEFRTTLKKLLAKSNNREEDSLSLAFQVLLDPGVHASWAQRIRTMLAS
jgi:hypothetical protein